MLNFSFSAINLKALRPLISSGLTIATLIFFPFLSKTAILYLIATFSGIIFKISLLTFCGILDNPGTFTNFSSPALLSFSCKFTFLPLFWLTAILSPRQCKQNVYLLAACVAQKIMFLYFYCF